MEANGEKDKSAKALFHFAYKSLSNLKPPMLLSSFAFLFVAVIFSRERSRRSSSFQLLMSLFQSRVACRNLP
jgi:hypothetical protein